MEQTNQTANTPLTPRISRDDFQHWVVQQPPAWLLTPLCYTYCVDGCSPAETTERFRMVEHISRQAGKTEADLANWHKLFGDLYEDDPEVFVEGSYHLKRRETAALTVLQLISTVEEKQAEYLIEPYLPKGMITVLGGVSGVGKTWLALYWAAKISRTFAIDEPGAVYYFTQENDPAIVLRPRLDALCAETERIAVQRFDDFSAGLTLDDDRIEAAAKEIPPKLVIFDPIQSYLGAGVEMNKANEVRPILDWLSRFAQRYNCAVVLVSHMSKPGANNTDALDRLLGSSDFRNAARSIIIVGRDPDDPDVRVFAHAKNSIGQPGPSRRYKVSSHGVKMLGECDLTANEIIRVGAKSSGRPPKSLDAAVAALKELMGDKGWTSLDDVKKLCNDKGISLATMQRAKRDMQLNVLRAGLNSWWTLPEKHYKSIEELKS